MAYEGYTIYRNDFKESEEIEEFFDKYKIKYRSLKDKSGIGFRVFTPGATSVYGKNEIELLKESILENIANSGE